MSVAEAESAVTAAAQRLAEARAASESARSVVDTFTKQRAAYDKYMRDLSFLGSRPEVGVEPAEPKSPDTERPTPSSEAYARDVVRKASESVGARAVAEANVVTQQRKVQETTEAHQRAVREQAHVVALVAALRQAPGIIAREQAAALGDLGPMTIEFPAVTEVNPNPPAMLITVDGLPLEGASDGAVIEASLAFRLALRRLAKMPEIPVFVDRVNLLNGGNGPWPDAENVVYLVTTRGQGITVRAGVP